MHLEVVAGVPLLRADLREPGEQPVQFLAKPFNLDNLLDMLSGRPN